MFGAMHIARKNSRDAIMRITPCTSLGTSQNSGVMEGSRMPNPLSIPIIVLNCPKYCWVLLEYVICDVSSTLLHICDTYSHIINRYSSTQLHQHLCIYLFNQYHLFSCDYDTMTHQSVHDLQGSVTTNYCTSDSWTKKRQRSARSRACKEVFLS
jgi:hypothetical protein